MADGEMLAFDGLIRHWAREKPQQVALEQDGKALTFAELDQRHPGGVIGRSKRGGLRKIETAGGWKAYEKAHRTKLLATFVPKFTHLVPPELVARFLEFSFHLGFY